MKIITVGGHTLTATITDLEGKSKSVAVVLTCNQPRIGFSINPRVDHNGQPYDLRESDIPLSYHSDYPKANPFTISIGTWQYNTPSTNQATIEVTVTNMWNQRETKSKTVMYSVPGGGGEVEDQEKPPITDR